MHTMMFYSLMFEMERPQTKTHVALIVLDSKCKFGPWGANSKRRSATSGEGAGLPTCRHRRYLFLESPFHRKRCIAAPLLILKGHPLVFETRRPQTKKRHCVLYTYINVNVSTCQMSSRANSKRSGATSSGHPRAPK